MVARPPGETRSCRPSCLSLLSSLLPSATALPWHRWALLWPLGSGLLLSLGLGGRSGGSDSGQHSWAGAPCARWPLWVGGQVECLQEGESRGPPGEITWARLGKHVGPQGKSRGPPEEITWAPWGNHRALHRPGGRGAADSG